MNKEWFDAKMDDIEVPIEELHTVIEKGMNRGRKQARNKKRTKIALSLVSTAATIILALGLFFAPVTKVLASMPLIGTFYENFNLSMGQELEKKDLVTEIHQTVTDNGVEVTLTSVYYDGTYVGITFKAVGDELTLEVDHPYDFHLYEKVFDFGIVRMSTGGSRYDLQKVDDEYIGAIEIEYPKDDFPEELFFPLVFTSMGGVEGEWAFNVPVEQIPLKQITLDESYTTENDTYTFTLTSLSIGQSNMSIYYETNNPEALSKFDIYDNKGNEIGYDSFYSRGHDHAIFHTGLKSGTKYLLIYPTYLHNGKWVQLEPLKVDVK